MLLIVNASSVASCRERLVNREIRLEPTQSNPPVKLRPPVNQTPLRLPVVAKGESVVDTWLTERMNVAITRGVSSALSQCEVTYVKRGAIDVALAREQHRHYSAALQWAGLRVVQLPALESHPDGCFVEDTAVVLDEAAIVTTMGSASRRAEVSSVEASLGEHRELHQVRLPATIEGGDVLRVGKTLFIGRSSRTNAEGIAAAEAIAGRYGYKVVAVEVQGCLHLKTAVTALTRDTLIINPEWIDASPFRAFRHERVSVDEPWSGNVLTANGRAILHAGHTRAAEAITRLGIEVRAVDVGEFMKAEAGVTCLSILLATPASRS